MLGWIKMWDRDQSEQLDQFTLWQIRKLTRKAPDKDYKHQEVWHCSRSEKRHITYKTRKIFSCTVNNLVIYRTSNALRSLQACFRMDLWSKGLAPHWDQSSDHAGELRHSGRASVKSYLSSRSFRVKCDNNLSSLHSCVFWQVGFWVRWARIQS